MVTLHDRLGYFHPTCTANPAFNNLHTFHTRYQLTWLPCMIALAISIPPASGSPHLLSFSSKMN